MTEDNNKKIVASLDMYTNGFRLIATANIDKGVEFAVIGPVGTAPVTTEQAQALVAMRNAQRQQ